MPKGKKKSAASVSGPSSVFDAEAVIGLNSSGAPTREFEERTKAPGVEFVQFTRAGGRVIHARASTGDVVVAAGTYQARPISPRRLGPAIPDTTGKGCAWTQDRSLAL